MKKSSKKPREFVICAVRILDNCNLGLRKVLKDEWYLLNNQCRLNRSTNELEYNNQYNLTGFFGSGISVCAIVGMNGSGKSSLLEMIYRIVNNLGSLLIRGKRRRASEQMYFVDGLWAELYFIINGKLGFISCKGVEVSFGFKGEQVETLRAFDEIKPSKKTVLLEDFIKWARETLFYTIVTNYSVQAFCSQDFKEEQCFILDGNRWRQPSEDRVWINGLFHKNDGYMSPIVLNPYRDEGKLDMAKEHRLTKYRLSAAMLYSEQKKHEFMKDYKLSSIIYQFDRSELDKKYIEKAKVKESVYWNYKPGCNLRPDYGTVILCGYRATGLDFSDTVHRTVGLYLIYKTYSIANSYPSYDEFSAIGDLNRFTEETNSETEHLATELVNRIRRDKSHITLKIRQTLHFMEALLQKRFDTVRLLTDSFEYSEYRQRLTPQVRLNSMSSIQEYLPPSFFSIDIHLFHCQNGGKSNDKPISINRLSSGERQYLYTFSTYIYHILNLLSIQDSHRVRYRRFNLVFDEVEICFHPEFQRKFVYELLGYIRRMKMNSHATYNIIIATHSPFILTDIPQENILYLEDGHIPEQIIKNPFAANICDVLYQSFFLREGFVGEFARGKIRDVLAWLNTERHIRVTESRRAQFDTIVALIGDPFLQMQLKQLMAKKTGKMYEKADN